MLLPMDPPAVPFQAMLKQKKPDEVQAEDPKKREFGDYYLNWAMEMEIPKVNKKMEN